MDQTLNQTFIPTPAKPRPALSVLSSSPVERAYVSLLIGFTAIPLIAGADKFFNVLTDWEKYLAPLATQITGLNATTFMHIAGVIEIVAGIGAIVKPRIFGFVISAWLVGIVVNLLLLGQYYDVAARDFGLALGAFALGELALSRETKVR